MNFSLPFLILSKNIENSVNLITNRGDKNTILSLNLIQNQNIINNSSPENFIPGTLYLLRFLGYFSHNLYKISLNYQIKLKQFILSIFKILIETNFANFEWGFVNTSLAKYSVSLFSLYSK